MSQLFVSTRETPVTVFRFDRVSESGEEYTQYKVAIATDVPRARDNFVRYIGVVFKDKSVSLPNRAKIFINNAKIFIAEYKGKTSMKIMIYDFELLDFSEVK